MSCSLHNWVDWGLHFDGGIAGLVSGVTLAIEQPSRRQEVALYVAGQALRSFYFTWQKYLPQFAHGEVLIFSFAMAVLMNSYVTKSWLLRPGYFSMFRFLFGSGGLHEGFPDQQEAPECNEIPKPAPLVPVFEYPQVLDYDEIDDDVHHQNFQVVL